MEQQKVSKKQSGYEVISPKLSTGSISIGQRCDTCYSFSGPDKCALVKGKIARDASCILWSHGDIPILPNWVSGEEAKKLMKSGTKMSKIQAGYLCAIPVKLRPPKDKGFRCGTCVFFHPGSNGSGGCGIVTGQVNANGCCNLWKSEPGPKDYDFDSAEDLASVLKLHIIRDIEDLGCQE